MSMEFVFSTVLITIVLLVFIFLYFRHKEHNRIISINQIVEYTNNEINHDKMLGIAIRMLNMIDKDKVSPWLYKEYKKWLKRQYISKK